MGNVGSDDEKGPNNVFKSIVADAVKEAKLSSKTAAQRKNFANFGESMDKYMTPQIDKILTRGKEILKTIWTTYDANHDDILSKEENHMLMAHFLKELAKELPPFFKDLYDDVVASTSSVLPASERDEFLKYSADLSKHMRKEMEVMLREMTKRHKEVADQLYKRMDVNHDGVVDRMEFMTKFNLELKTVFHASFSIEAVMSRLENAER